MHMHFSVHSMFSWLTARTKMWAQGRNNFVYIFSGFLEALHKADLLRKANIPAWRIYATRSPGVLWQASHSAGIIPSCGHTINDTDSMHAFKDTTDKTRSDFLSLLYTVLSHKTALHWLVISFPTVSLAHAEKHRCHHS